MNSIYLVRPNIGQPLLFNAWPESFRITVAGKDIDGRPTRDTLPGILPPLSLHQPGTGVHVPLTVTHVREPVLYPLPYDAPDDYDPLLKQLPYGALDESSPYFFQHHARFQWEFPVIVSADWPDHLKRPAMWNIKMGEETNYHAIYVGRFPTFCSRFLHITDTHIAGRNDVMKEFFCETVYEEHWRKKEFSTRNINPNDNLRAIVRYANKKADAGKLDFVVLTGDIVDYIYDGYWDFHEGEFHYGYPPVDYLYRDPAHRSNFDVFVEIITGRSRSVRLKIPIFIVPGNHDYLAYEPLLAFDIHIPTSDKIEIMFRKLHIFSFLLTIQPVGLLIFDYVLSKDVPPEYQSKVDRYRRPRLSFREALMFDRWKQGRPYEPSDVAQPNIELGRALSLWLTPSIYSFAHEYLTKISYDTDFVFQIPSDGHQFVCLNSGWDIGIATKQKLYDYALGDAELTRLEELAMKGHVRTSGLRPIQEELLTKALNKAGTDYSVVLFHHAPILSEEFYSDELSKPLAETILIENLGNLAELENCDYDTALDFSKLLGLEKGPCAISLSGHTHKATEHQLTLIKEPDKKSITIEMWSGQYSVEIDQSLGFNLSGQYPFLFQSGSLVSPRPMVREIQLKWPNKITKASLHQDLPRYSQLLPVGTMAPFLSAAVVRFSELGYKGHRANLYLHQTLSEEAANWDTDLILAEMASHFHNLLDVVSFYYGFVMDGGSFSHSYIDKYLLLKNESQQFIKYHDLWKRLQIEGEVGWYDIYVATWTGAFEKIHAMVEEAFGKHWLRELCGLYDLTYPPQDGDYHDFSMKFLFGGLVCIGMALWLNRFGITGDSRIYPIDLEKKEFEEEFHRLVFYGHWIPFDYSGYVIERLVKLFSFVEEKRKYPLCLWYTFESTYLAEEGGYSNPEWNNLDPSYHLKLARTMSKPKMVKELINKYHLQCQHQMDTLGVDGLKEFYARSGVRLNAWLGTFPINEARFISGFINGETAEDTLVEKVKLLAEKLMPYPPPPDPDIYEPNDNFEQAIEVDLTTYPEPTLQLDQLTLHRPEDKDVFLITYPEIDEEAHLADFDCEWFVMTSSDAYLFIRATEGEEYLDFETSFTFALYDYAQKMEKIKAECTHESGVSKPTEIFTERSLYLQVTNPDHILLRYVLEIALIEPSGSVQAKKPLMEARWFDWPWESTIFEDPAVIVEQLVNQMKYENLDPTLAEKKDLAHFQNELGRFAESFKLFDKAEELFLASSARYEEIDDINGAISVLHNLESLYTRLNNTEKATEIRKHIEGISHAIDIP